MKRILAIGAAAGALMAASSGANAQECVNGWTTIKDQVLVRCEMGLTPAFAGPGQPLEQTLDTSDAAIADEEGGVAGSSGGNAEQIVEAQSGEFGAGDGFFEGDVAAADQGPGATGPGSGNGNSEEILQAQGSGMFVEGPVYTGSIGTVGGGATGPGSSGGNADQIPGHWSFVGSASECQPGSYYMLELESGDRPVAC
jgi:hypothetical protein